MFFSVKTTLKIAGKVYTPCICYEAGEILKPTIEKLVAEGKAYMYPQRVFFQNGKVLEGMKAEAPAMDFTEKKSKKNKKEIPSPEEIADNPEDIDETEGF